MSKIIKAIRFWKMMSKQLYPIIYDLLQYTSRCFAICLQYFFFFLTFTVFEKYIKNYRDVWINQLYILLKTSPINV